MAGKSRHGPFGRWLLIFMPNGPCATATREVAAHMVPLTVDGADLREFTGLMSASGPVDPVKVTMSTRLLDEAFATLAR